jgi:hypothetical protein
MSAPSLPGTYPLSPLRTFLRHCSLLTQAPASNAGATSRSLEQSRHPADHTEYIFSEQRRRPPRTTAWLVQSREGTPSCFPHRAATSQRRSSATESSQLANHSNLVALPSSSSTLKQSSLRAFNRWNRARLPLLRPCRPSPPIPPCPASRDPPDHAEILRVTVVAGMVWPTARLTWAAQAKKSPRPTGIDVGTLAVGMRMGDRPASSNSLVPPLCRGACWLGSRWVVVDPLVRLVASPGRRRPSCPSVPYLSVLAGTDTT